MKYIHYILKNKGAWRYKGADHRAVGMLLHNPSRRGYMKKMWELWNLLYLTSRLTVKQLVVQCNIWKRQLISQLEINEVQHICYGRGWGGRTSSLRLGTKVQQQLVRWRCWEHDKEINFELMTNSDVWNLCETLLNDLLHISSNIKPMTKGKWCDMLIWILSLVSLCGKYMHHWRCKPQKKKKTRANLSAALCHQAKLVYNSLHSDETHLEITLSQGLTRQT